MATAQLTEQGLLIGGRWVESGSGRTFERSDPYTGETVGRVAAATR